jgi:hypothetical protein
VTDPFGFAPGVLSGAPRLARHFLCFAADILGETPAVLTDGPSCLGGVFSSLPGGFERRLPRFPSQLSEIVLYSLPCFFAGSRSILTSELRGPPSFLRRHSRFFPPFFSTPEESLPVHLEPLLCPLPVAHCAFLLSLCALLIANCLLLIANRLFLIANCPFLIAAGSFLVTQGLLLVA